MPKVAPSAALSTISGRFAGIVVANTKSGLVIRREAKYKRAQSDAQRESVTRLRRAAEVWAGFDYVQAGAWDDYAQTVWRHNHLTSEAYHPSGYNAFSALATKVLQINPAAEIPTAPPVGEYFGDVVTLSVQGLQMDILFTASAPNSPSTTTELLLERLPNERRKSTGRLVSAGFHQFHTGSLEVFQSRLAGMWRATASSNWPRVGRPRRK